MHPPFFTVDHKIGPDIHHHGDSRPVVRRNRPARLVLSPCVAGWPPVPLAPTPLEDDHGIQAPGGSAITRRPRLQVVPPPRRTLREIIGRMLIRTGQRMILAGQ